MRIVRRLRSNRNGFGTRPAAGADATTPVPELGEAEALHELGLLLAEQGDLANRYVAL